MSDQEQQQTPQVEEAAKDAANVQPEAATTDAPPAADAVVESTENSGAPEEVNEPEPEAEQQPTDGEAPEKSEESPANAESQQTEQSSEATQAEEQKVDEVAENGKAEDEKSAELNGATETTEAGDETNGVHKRKAENGAEPVADDEKSPKKAKVVDDAEQAKVEETAA